MKTSILIVDDQALICLGLERLLSDEYIVHKASNGKEALEIFSQNSDIKIILTDIMMPVMDGTEMIEKVRIDNKQVTIIAMTAVFSGEVISEIMEKGADMCLTKPVDIPQLQATLRKSLKTNTSTETH